MTADSPDSPAIHDQDAVRVIAAALVAQQASADERDIALNERTQALQEQEMQLSERLAEKQQQLERLHEQLADAREQFRRERDRQSATLDEAAKIHGEAVAERERLRDLRGKFLRRWKRHWAGERSRWQKKSGELDSASSKLQSKLEAIDSRHQRLAEERQLFKAEQARWYHETKRTAEQLQILRDSLNEKQRQLGDFEWRLRDEKARLGSECESLRSEARALEKRITSARRVLIAQALQPGPAPQTEIAEIPQPPSEIPLPEAVEDLFAEREQYHRHCHEDLQQQSATLADQRLHLAEMFERLAEAEKEWHGKQVEAVTEMERLATDLEQREAFAIEQHREMDAATLKIRPAFEQLANWRRELDRTAADLALRQSTHRGEADRLRAEFARREQLSQRRERALNDLLERWRKRRQAEADRLRTLAQAAIAARQAFMQSRDEYRDRAESLREAQQALAAQALALEEVKQEFLAETDRPKAAARRFERLRRRWERRNARVKREVIRTREALAAEDAELHRIYEELLLEQSTIVAKEQELGQKETALEHERRSRGDGPPIRGGPKRLA